MKEKILILAKTYPTLSSKYFELVCTAGINERGEWRRLYPIRFRELTEIEKYKKYQWVNVDIERNFSDQRPESYKPISEIDVCSDVMSTKHAWALRKNYLFDTANIKVYDDLTELIRLAKENICSLAMFKPSRIMGLKIEKTEEHWDEKKLALIERENRQGILFEHVRREINLVPKLPYKFSYFFQDSNGKQSTLMIEDWEIGQLYWNCYYKHRDKEKAAQDVRNKYEENFIQKRDIYLFLGTTRKYSSWARNPFVIIGVFYPPKQGADIFS